MGFTVAQVAELAGVTVRTLHHYNKIGLLEPQDRTRAGYRQYASADLDRLRNILFYRELGFGLDKISTIMDDPVTAARDHLRQQRELLTAQISRLRRMVNMIDKELEAHTMGIQLTPEEKFEIFGENYSPDYETEAEERWGDTDAWRQSQERTSRYTKQDWIRFKENNENLHRRLAEVMRSGTGSDSDAAMDLAEEHRRSVEAYYDCSYEMHRRLGDMWLADDRFARHYEAVEPGLTQWFRDAVYANAARHGRESI